MTNVGKSAQLRLSHRRSLLTEIIQYNSQDGDTVRSVTHHQLIVTRFEPKTGASFTPARYVPSEKEYYYDIIIMY